MTYLTPFIGRIDFSNLHLFLTTIDIISYTYRINLDLSDTIYWQDRLFQFTFIFTTIDIIYNIYLDLFEIMYWQDQLAPFYIFFLLLVDILSYTHLDLTSNIHWQYRLSQYIFIFTSLDIISIHSSPARCSIPHST